MFSNQIITVYGINNCDTVKKTCKWLQTHNITYLFHDLRIDGISEQQLTDWTSMIDWQSLFNKRSTSYRNLPLTDKENLTQQKAIQLMHEQPTLIKRPVIEVNEMLIVGFNEKNYQQTFL